MNKGRGGSTIVELACKGHRELIHELTHPDWLGNLTIEKPDELRESIEIIWTSVPRLSLNLGNDCNVELLIGWK